MSVEVRRAAYGVLLAAFDGTTVPAWLSGAYDDGLAGICLYGNNIQGHSRDAGAELAALARTVRELAPHGVLTLDEEGGDVTRLHAARGSQYPGNAALGRVDDLDATRAVAAAIGAELRDAGVWFDLAPVGDVNSNWRNPVIGTRSFGADPALVARHVVAYLDGLAGQGVAGCVKHFPGHGDTAVDSHVCLPTVTADEATLRERELLPFEAAIGAPAIMTSHVVLSALDPHRPATLSPRVLTGLLRDELGYQGVIVTDALDMAGASREIGIPAAAVASLAAGADLLCLGPLTGPDPVVLHSCVAAIEAAVADGTLPRQRLFDAADRVRNLCADWANRPAAAPGAIEIGRIRGRAVADRLFSDVPALTGAADVVRVVSETNPAVGGTTWGDLHLGGTVRDVPADGLDRQPPPTGPVVLISRSASSDPRIWAWLSRCLDANPAAVAVELGWPTPAAQAHPRVICTWGQSQVLTAALDAALRRPARRTLGTCPPRSSAAPAG